MIIYWSNKKEICILEYLNARVGRRNDNAIIGKYEENVWKWWMDFTVTKTLTNTPGHNQEEDYIIMRQQSNLKTLDVKVYQELLDHRKYISKLLYN